MIGLKFPVLFSGNGMSWRESGAGNGAFCRGKREGIFERIRFVHRKARFLVFLTHSTYSRGNLIHLDSSKCSFLS